MKDRIVFWGADARDKDIIVLVQLRAVDNKLDIWTFPKEGTPTDFVNEIFKIKEKDVADVDPSSFPEGHTYLEHTMEGPSLLPDHIKAKNTNVVNLAEKEWYVKILSLKLFSELNAKAEQLEALVASTENYDQEHWDIAVSQSKKLQHHVSMRDISREQFKDLRDRTDKVFDSLKAKRKESNKHREKASKEQADKISTEVNAIREQIAKGRSFKGMSMKLRNLQAQLKGLRLPRLTRDGLYEQFDEAFDLLRANRGSDEMNRLKKRITDLEKIYQKIERSLSYDRKDLEFAHKRARNPSNQFEAQLSKAKIDAIEARKTSKAEKLDGIQETLEELRGKLKKEEDMMAKALEKREEATRKAKEIAEKRAQKEAAAKARKEEAKRQAEENKAAKAEEVETKQADADVDADVPKVEEKAAAVEVKTVEAAKEEIAENAAPAPEDKKEDETEGESDDILKKWG